MGRSNLKTFVRYLKNAKTKDEKKAVFDLTRIKIANKKSALAVKKVNTEYKETLLYSRKVIKYIKKTLSHRKIVLTTLKKKLLDSKMSVDRLEKDITRMFLLIKKYLDPRSDIRNFFEEIYENF